MWRVRDRRQYSADAEPARRRRGRGTDDGSLAGGDDRFSPESARDRRGTPLSSPYGDAAEDLGGEGARQGRDRKARGRRYGRLGLRQYTWRDFELGEDLPRTYPRDRGTPYRPDGRQHCGPLEEVLYRQWDGTQAPGDAVVRAIDSLAALPDRLKAKLADGLDGIYVGGGGVPDLDDMAYLRDVSLPSGQATWDICAGAYGDRKIIVGDQPSPTPDVMMHEVGHALDDIDAPLGRWQSDSREFRALYEQCRSHLATQFHQQPDGLGRREFFADAFAAIASRQRPALVDMCGGDTRTALQVMLYFNRRYGI